MILADVNVLLYAFRGDAPEHAKAKIWLEDVINGASAFAVSPQILSSVVRISTHPRIYQQPSALDEALDFCRVLLSVPQAVIVTPGERHWKIFEAICRESDARGNLVQDAWLAGLAIEWGCEWNTLDRDFARFPGLKWRVPF